MGSFQLAVTNSGEALAAWFSGEPRPAEAAPPLARAASAGSSKGQTLTVARGTVEGGLGSPVVLTAPSPSEGPVYVAVSASGSSYVLWPESYAGPTAESAAAAGATFSAPRTLLPSGTHLVALVQSPEGPVAVVWITDRRSTAVPVLQYALLQPAGGLGRVVTIGRLPFPAFGSHFALNDSGELAVVGVSAGSALSAPPARPTLVLCDPEGRCSRRLTAPLAETGALVEETVTLADGGAATVIAVSNGPCAPKDRSCGGVWAATRSPGGRWLAPRRLADAIGGLQLVASADGPDALITDYARSELEPHSILWSGLEADGKRITTPAPLEAPPGYRQPDGDGEPVLAANAAGDFLFSWCTVATSPPRRSTSVEVPCDAVTATLGEHDQLGSAQLLDTASEEVEGVRAGLDGAGNAIVMWHSSSGGTSRLWASTHQR